MQFNSSFARCLKFTGCGMRNDYLWNSLCSNYNCLFINNVCETLPLLTESCLN